MKKTPTIIQRRAGTAITSMPKIMQMMARIGLETVTPIFFNPFSTTSVKFFHLCTFIKAVVSHETI